MGMVMLVAMSKMLPHRRINLALFAAFLRSMIPHHSRAIHMCQEAALADPEIMNLCDQIIETQREEIALMERMLESPE